MKVHVRPKKPKKRKSWEQHVTNLREQAKIAKEKGDVKAAAYCRGLADGIEQCLTDL